MHNSSYDVVVVGAGLAGFTAAVRCAEHGVKVLLIDKSHGALGDGNTLMASGSLRAGGKSPRTPPAELYEFVMAEGVGHAELVRAWADCCAPALDWLAAEGVELEETVPGRIWLRQESEISLAPVYKKDVGRRALATLKSRLDQLGGRYLNGTEAVSLIAENRSVRGVVARQKNESLELRATATILTTGGFSANKELLQRYIGANADRCKLRGSRQCTGDGLRMALQAGAAAVNLEYFYGHLIARKALIDDRFWPYPRLDAFVEEGLLIDRSGSRFVDEGRGDVAVANELARLDDPTGAILIFDHQSWEASRDNPSSTSLKIPTPNPWLHDQDGELYCADSIEKLATMIDARPELLASTLAEYHRAVEANRSGALSPSRTGKPKVLRPPFYALRVVPGITFTMGGVRISGSAEALSKRGDPIGGLYAAGDAIGGLMGGYRGGYTGGLMQAVVTGFLAGENAANFVIKRSQNTQGLAN